MKNQKQVQELKAMLDVVTPNYMPGDKAFFVDKRAKRIVKVEVVESLTKYSAIFQTDEKDKATEIVHYYEVTTSIGNMAIEDSKMVRNYKDAALKLGQLLID